MTDKIEQLTPEQERELEEWCEEWLAIDACCEPADRPRVEAALERLYSLEESRRPLQILWFLSPPAVWGHPLLLPTKGGMSSPFGKTKPCWHLMVSEARESVAKRLGQSPMEAIPARIDSCGYRERFRQSHLFVLCREESLDTRLAIALLFCERLGVEYDTVTAMWLGAMAELLRVGNEYWLGAEYALACDRPCEVHHSENLRVIHCDGGPAVVYRDGYTVWALNGVKVPQEVAETPADELDAQWVVREQNAEVRREVVRKIGIDRVLRDLNARCVDRATRRVPYPVYVGKLVGREAALDTAFWTTEECEHEYELLELGLGDGRRRPYLRMTNPSTGECHIEGVPPDVDSVRAALAWRDGGDAAPVALT